MSNKQIPYLKHSKAGLTTANLGWHMAEGGRDCPPPELVEYVIGNIPFRSGEIDVSKELGLEPTYPMRELRYKLFKSAGSADDLVSWLASCRNAELFDSFAGCTFENVTFKTIEFEADMRNAQVVNITFKANPFKKGGGL